MSPKCLENIESKHVEEQVGCTSKRSLGVDVVAAATRMAAHGPRTTTTTDERAAEAASALEQPSRIAQETGIDCGARSALAPRSTPSYPSYPLSLPPLRQAGLANFTHATDTCTFTTE